MSLAFTRDGTRIVGAAVRGHPRLGRRLRARSSRPTASRSGTRRSAGARDRPPRDWRSIFTRRRDRHRVGPRRRAARSGAGSAGATRQGRLRAEPVHGDRPARHGDGDEPRRREGGAARPAQQADRRTSCPRATATPAEAARLPSGGRRLATGGTAGTVTIWDVPSRRGRAPAALSPEPVWAVAVSPDGTLIAVQRQRRGAQRRARGGTRPAHPAGRSTPHGSRFGLGGLAFTRRRPHADRLRVLRAAGRRSSAGTRGRARSASSAPAGARSGRSRCRPTAGRWRSAPPTAA